MNFIMLEKIGAVSMRNGIVRVQGTATAADGQDQVTCELCIPAAQYGHIIAGLQYAGKQLNEKMEQALKDQKEEEGKLITN